MKRTILILLLLVQAVHVFAQNPAEMVKTILEREIKERGIPGLQYAIVHKGVIVMSGGYGIANLSDQVHVDHKSIFAVNSITKVFSAVAVMQLVEQGKVKLTDPIGKYIDSLPPSWQTPSIQQLLTHSSGLPDLLKLLDPRTGGLGIYKNENEVIEKLKGLPIDFPPGEKFSYNQTNAYLIGKLIELLEKKTFAEVFAEKQFLPIKMEQTVFGDSRDVIPHFAPTYFIRNMEDGRALKEKKLINNYYEFPYFRRTASGLNSSAQDIAKWLIALQSGKILKEKQTLQTMWTPITFNNGKPTPWALGWGMNKYRSKHRAVGMSGGGRAAFLLYPEDELAVIILTNLGGSYPEDFLEEIAGCFIPEILKADPVTFLRTSLRTSGYEKAIQLTELQMKADPNFKPKEFELNEWAYRMITKNQLKEAKAILELNVHLFPLSANAYDSYGDVLLKAGEREKGILMYKKSLELDPTNEHAKKVIQGINPK